MVLYRLSDGNLNGKMDSQEYYNASAVLKSFAILKYELRKKEPGKEEAYAIQFFIKGLFSTLAGNIFGSMVSITFLVSLGITYAIDFISDQIQSKIKLSPDFTWDQYSKMIKENPGRYEVLIP